jgi:RNA recognition motif-containing protein
MSNSDEAQQAINMFHGTQFHERTLTVNIARPAEERGPGGGQGHRARSLGQPKQRRNQW